ncbi:MAG: peptidoglycan DD-metalloendopeptidase family protein [Bacteroidales bacterium]|nr:peptidoglycan DD-metalloendopeptidase family protein [Bacteroidales bacterium]
MKTFKYLCMLVICTVGLTLLSGNLQAQNRQKLENEKAKLEKEIASMNAILKETKKKNKMSASELQIIRKKVEQRQQLVNNITSQVNMLDEQINQTKQSIGEEYRNLEILKQNYAQMLRYAQRNKSATDKLLFIFSAKDYHEAYQRYVFFRKFAQIQRQQMALITKKTNELTTMAGDLITQKQSQNILLRQEKAHAATLQKEKVQKEQAVKDIKSQEKQLTKQIQQAQAKKKKLQQQINAAINAEIKKQQQLAAQKNSASNKNTATTPKKNSTTSTPSKKEEYTMLATAKDVELNKGFEGNKGKLPWPVDKGVIVSSFGVHEHPDIKGVQIENQGIDIRTTKGSAVKSIYEGEVCSVFQGPNGKKVVIIRHGEYMSVYTNLESTSVSKGSKVSMGQKIGTISTNENGQSEMNFQVRKGTKTQNPVLWLRR